MLVLEVPAPISLLIFAAVLFKVPLLNIAGVPVSFTVAYLPSKSTVTATVSLPALVSVNIPFPVLKDAELTYLSVFVEEISMLLPLRLTVVAPAPLKVTVSPALIFSTAPASARIPKLVVFVLLSVLLIVKFG